MPLKNKLPDNLKSKYYRDEDAYALLLKHKEQLVVYEDLDEMRKQLVEKMNRASGGKEKYDIKKTPSYCVVHCKQPKCLFTIWYRF